MGRLALCERYALTDENLAERRRFLGIGPEDQALMLSLEPWAREVAADLAREFYDWQFEFEPTLAFFRAFAAKRGIDLATLRLKLEQTQARYFSDLFAGAQCEWGTPYFETRVKIGIVHDRIDLPQKWYVGSYAELGRLIEERLARRFRWNLGARRRAQRSVSKILNYDMQAVVDSFLLRTIESLQLRIDALGVGKGQDRTELLGALKGQARRFSTSLEENAEALTSVAAAAEELGNSIHDISRNTHEAASVAGEAQSQAHAAAEVIQQLHQAGREIGDVIKLITAITEQTKLLALNATVEAARAGSAGRGFAVVADEVKELAAETASSTENVVRRITTIQRGVASAQEAITAVSERIGLLASLSTSVAGAVEEQSVVVSEISQRVHRTAEENAEVLRFLDRSSDAPERRAVSYAGGAGGPALLPPMHGDGTFVGQA